MTKTDGLSSFKVAATYIGIVIGAGFASGQEMLLFFGYFGRNGVLGLAIATVLFIFFGRIILNLGRRLGAESHLPVVRKVGGRWLGTAIDGVVTFFLFGGTVAMAAGAGAILHEQFGVSTFWGTLLMVLILVGTVLSGLAGVVSAISYVVPVMFIAVVGISLYTILDLGLVLAPAAPPVGQVHPVPYWLLSAVVYVSYNLVVAAAVLAPLGKEAGNRDILARGSLWGGLGLGLGALFILLAVLANLPGAAGVAVPMIYVAGKISPSAQLVYSLVLLAEVYTTAVGSLYGFVARLVEPKGQKFYIYVLGSGLVALLAAQVGFVNLVRVLYPVVGYAGLFFLGALVLEDVKNPLGH